MKKKIFITVLFFLSFTCLCARSFDLVFTFPTALYVNTGDKQVSAPSPIYFNPGIGAAWPKEKTISVEPAVNLSYGYFLFNEGRALPAEIENREATVLSLLLNVPAVYSFPIKSTKLRVNAGGAMLMRFAWKADADSDDSNVKEIRKYLWGNARFLYISGGVDWSVPLPSSSRFGPFMNFFLPIGSIFAGEGLNGMILQAGLKLSI